MREETSLLGHKVREAGSDVLVSLRARASSHLSALLSPARDSSPPHPRPPLEHEDEIDADDDGMSPVYEEASDLASSIAKLKALLQHHDQKSSSTEDEEILNQPVVANVKDVHVDETSHHDKRRQSTEESEIDPTVLPGIETGIINLSETECMEAEEAPELPNDGRPFMNINITATELSCDASGQQFVQYCIQVNLWIVFNFICSIYYL